MFRWKSCPRCKGDVIVDRDEYGWYELCLMCGYIGDPEPVMVEQKRGRKPHPEHKERI